MTIVDSIMDESLADFMDNDDICDDGALTVPCQYLLLYIDNSTEEL